MFSEDDDLRDPDFVLMEECERTIDSSDELSDGIYF